MSLYRNQVFKDIRGKLTVFEPLKNIPFEIKRVFCISDVGQNQSRGAHAHFRVKQFLVAVQGSCRIDLDDGNEKKSYLLDGTDQGVFQDAMVWGNMSEFSKDCVLLVLASEVYEEEDYIHDYDEFRLLKSRN